MCTMPNMATNYPMISGQYRYVIVTNTTCIIYHQKYGINNSQTSYNTAEVCFS